MPRYKLTLEYDGTDFAGWQKQEPYADAVEPNARLEGRFRRDEEEKDRVQLRTVQQVVERAVREVVREPVVLMGASRTDAGVHARGQVAAFTCSGDEPVPLTFGSSEGQGSPPRGLGWPLSRGTDRLLRAINGRLPDDVQVVRAEPAEGAFNPIGDALEKAYSYTLHIAPDGQRPLWDRRYVHQIREDLDLAAMQAAAAAFEGEHDFAAFAAAGHGRLSTVRTVTACSVAREGPRTRIDIAGNGFLWNMVRIVAGTLVHVGCGRIAAGDIPTIIVGVDRTRAGPTLPPTGLCLERIRY